MQRPRPQYHRGLLGLLTKLHRSDQSSLSACQISSRPFPYGQEYLGTPQKISSLLPQEGQGERYRKKRCATDCRGQTAMEVALEPPQEASQYLWGGKAGHCSPGKRGCRFCAPLPKHHPTAGEYLRLFTQRSPSEAQTATAAPGDQRCGRRSSAEDSHLL